MCSIGSAVSTLIGYTHLDTRPDKPVEDIYNTINELAIANFITVTILNDLFIYLKTHAVKKIIKLALNDLKKQLFSFILHRQ